MAISMRAQDATLRKPIGEPERHLLGIAGPRSRYACLLKKAETMAQSEMRLVNTEFDGLNAMLIERVWAVSDSAHDLMGGR